MKWMIAAAGIVVLGLLGLVSGWFVGQGLDASGLMDAETFWHTDPENMWAWCALAGGGLGLLLGAGLVVRRW